MSSWQYAHIGLAGDGAEIGGLKVWEQEWRRVKTDRVYLPHPQYPRQIDPYDIYEIGRASRPVRFAAGELSAGVWGFYVPKS